MTLHHGAALLLLLLLLPLLIVLLRLLLLPLVLPRLCESHGHRLHHHSERHTINRGELRHECHQGRGQAARSWVQQVQLRHYHEQNVLFERGEAKALAQPRQALRVDNWGHHLHLSVGWNNREG